MPTIKQLPLASRVASDDVVPISQNGVTRNVSVGTLLSSTQPAIVNPTNRLLGRTSLGAGGPEPITIGSGLAITSGALAATGADHAAFPAATALSATDDLVINSQSGPRRLPVAMMRGLFTAGENVSIDTSGRISATVGAAATGAKGDPGPIGSKGDVGPVGPSGPAGNGLPPPTPANTVTTLQASFLPAFLRPDGTVVYSTMDTFKAFLLGTASPAPSVAITAVTFSPLGPVPASSPAGTVLGTLGATVSGGALVNPVYSLVSSAGGDVKLVGQQVKLNVNNLPAGAYAFRARVVADNATAREDDLSFTIAAAGTTPAPIAGSGVGIDFDFGYGHAGTLAVPFSYKAVTAMPVGEVVPFAQPSAAKDLPAGWRWYAQAADGTRVPVQQDLEGTFADGSLETSALTITSTIARAAGETVPLTLHAEQVAPDRTPCFTHAQMRAALANLRMEVTGYDLGSDTFVMPAAWVLDNCKEWTVASPGWGSDPVGGWQYLKRGPQLVELLIWGYYRNPALTASHKWLRVDLLCQRLANGAWDVGVIQSQPNAFNAHPAGTLGSARQARIACVARLKDGATVIRTWGAAGDPSAVTRPVTAINRTTGAIDFAGGFADDQGGNGAVIAFSGANLPPITPAGSTFGHLHNIAEGSFITVERHTTDAGTLKFGVGGSGDVTFVPLATTWPNSFLALYDVDGSRIRWGGSARPTVLPMHDRGYLTQRAKIVPAMNLALPDLSLTNQFKPKHVLGSATHFMWGLNATSNGAGDDRLGYITSTQAALLWAPTDEARHRRAIVNSLSFMTFHIAHWDETSGTEVVYTNGPLADGTTTYPGMGPLTPDWTTYSGYNNIGIGNVDTPNPGPRQPGHFYRAKWKQEPGVRGWSGYQNQYDVMFEGSHAPNHHLVPWLRTADYVHLVALRACACIVNSAGSGMVTVNGKTQPISHDGGRNFAWHQSLMSCGESALWDGAPGKQMLFDMTEQNAAYFGEVAPITHPGRFMGMIFGGGAAYMMAYAHLVVAHEVLKGKHPKYRRALECASIWSVGNYDDQGAIANGGYNIGMYGNGPSDYNPNYFPSLMSYNTAAYGAPPYPASGFRDGTPALTYTLRAEIDVIRLMRSCHAMGLASIPSAARVESQILARLGATGSSLEPGSNGSTYLYPLWDLVSLLPPPATVVPNGTTGGVVSNLMARSATVTWTPPSVGGPVFSYRLRLKKGGGAYTLLAENHDEATISMTGLLDNAVNVLEITARNPAGLSTTSAEVSFTTPVEITGTITGATATIGKPATFTATFTNISSVWVCLTVGGVDVGSRVQISKSGGTTDLTSNSVSAQVGSMYTAQTGGLLIDTTPAFIPDPSPVSLYNFEWKPTEVGTYDPHNSPVGNSFFFKCKLSKKDTGLRADINPKFIICTTGTDPRTVTSGIVSSQYYENPEGDFIFYNQYAEQYTGPGVFDLWIATADGEYNKDPSGVYKRYAP